MAFEFHEKTADNGQGISSAAFSRKVSRCNATWQLKKPTVGESPPVTPAITAQDLIDFIPTIVGNTSMKSGYGGKLLRTLPKAHAAWPFMFVEAINNVRGLGSQAKSIPNRQLEAPTMPGFDKYERYEMDLLFTTRPYASLKDDAIVPSQRSFYDIDGTSKNLHYAPEWLRFVDYDVRSATSAITFKQGASTFRGGAAAGTKFPHMPRITLPDFMVEMIWYDVPYRYVTSPSSYLNRFQGRCNQGDWFNWSDAQLIYLNYRTTRYTPPVPELVKMPNGNGTYSTDKTCDIALLFLGTYRVPGPGSSTTVANQNWRTSGCNAVPWWGDKRFYFATVDIPDVTKQTPSFLSAPFELLFTDPDLKQTEPPI